jgi:hypothetical protein
VSTADLPQSGFDPATGICWQFNRGRAWYWGHYTACPACSTWEGPREYTRIGRCRSAQRWFWAVTIRQVGGAGTERASGFADTEAEAFAAMQGAVLALRTVPLVVALYAPGVASHELLRLRSQGRLDKLKANSNA